MLAKTAPQLCRHRSGLQTFAALMKKAYVLRSFSPLRSQHVRQANETRWELAACTTEPPSIWPPLATRRRPTSSTGDQPSQNLVPGWPGSDCKATARRASKKKKRTVREERERLRANTAGRSARRALTFGQDEKESRTPAGRPRGLHKTRIKGCPIVRPAARAQEKMRPSSDSGEACKASKGTRREERYAPSTRRKYKAVGVYKTRSDDMFTLCIRPDAA